MSTRHQFDERLHQIQSEVIRMAEIASDMVRRAIETATRGDPGLADAIIVTDDEVDRLEEQAIQDTILAVMQEAPVASDLRFLVGTLEVIHEIEKVADDATKLARRAAKLATSFPGELKAPLHQIGELARQAFGLAMKQYLSYDPAVDADLHAIEAEVDGRYDHVRRALLERISESPEAARVLLRTIEVFRAVEHVSDRAVEIAARMRYVTTGADLHAKPEPT